MPAAARQSLTPNVGGKEREGSAQSRRPSARRPDKGAGGDDAASARDRRASNSSAAMGGSIASPSGPRRDSEVPKGKGGIAAAMVERMRSRDDRGSLGNAERQPSNMPGGKGAGRQRAGAKGAGAKEQKKRDDELRAALQERLERLAKEYDAELAQWQEMHRRDRQEAADTRKEAEAREGVIRDLERQLRERKEEHEQYVAKTRDFEEEMQAQLTRLTIERHELTQKCDGFDAVRVELQTRNQELQTQVQGLELRVRDADRVRHGLEHEASVMEQNLKRALNTARRDNLALRMTHTAQERELQKRLVGVEEELQNLVTRVEQAVDAPLDVRFHVAQDMNDHIDLLRIRYQDLLQQCRLKASRLSEELIKVSSLHSNIPEYIKARLATQKSDELRRLIDTLAFDESVRQYLEALFPAPFDSPDSRRTTWCPDTPSAALAHGDIFVMNRRQEKRPAASPDEPRPQTAPGCAGDAAEWSVPADARPHSQQADRPGAGSKPRQMLGNLAAPLSGSPGAWAPAGPPGAWDRKHHGAVPGGRVLPALR